MKKYVFLQVFVIFSMCLLALTVSAAELEIDTDFPGGNIVVDSINGDTIRVRPELRDSRDWFYYAFRVKNGEGRTLRFVFDADNRVGARGPAISSDEGKTWRYLSEKPGHSSREFTCTLGSDEKSVIFAQAILYTQRNWEEFVAPLKENENVTLGTLCKSRKGREVEMMRIGAENKDAKFAVVFTCRHHCCEMTASFAMEGIISTVLSDTPEGKWLRENATFLFVPFIDKDGVEDGDQGKGRKPHDHNRDYNHELYPEIKNLKAYTVENFSDKQLFFLDLHCPWIRYGMNEYLYSPMPKRKEMQVAVTEFYKIFEKYQEGAEIPYKEAWNLPFGKDWNNEKNYYIMENGILTSSSKTFFGDLPNAILAGTIEIPYSNSSDVEVTPKNVRELGNNLGKTLAEYLKSK